MYNCKTLIATDNEAASSDKKLSICLMADGFSFAVTSTDGMLHTFGLAEGTHASSMTEVMSDVKQFLADAHIRPLAFASSELVVISDESTWVPDELYSSLSNRQYLRLVGGPAFSVMTCHDEQLASTAVFAANEQTVMAFKVAVPGIVVRHQHAKLARLAPCSATHPVLVTYWRKGRVDVAALRGGKYLFGNTLEYGSDDEALFRIVEVVKAFEMETPSTELLLCGDVDRERYARLRPYFPKITLYSGSATRFANPEFKKLHTYRHALILS